MTEQDDARIADTETLNDDYDSPWKDAVEHYFPEFMAFYFPEAYDCFDWNLGYAFLEQELRSVIHEAALGKRFVDNWRNLNIKMVMKAGFMFILKSKRLKITTLLNACLPIITVFLTAITCPWAAFGISR